jgi:hypothetical protein
MLLLALMNILTIPSHIVSREVPQVAKSKLVSLKQPVEGIIMKEVDLLEFNGFLEIMLAALKMNLYNI